ncbi:MAG: hypothetical protein AABX88_01280 [Nanoarchaeota archaeon]
MGLNIYYIIATIGLVFLITGIFFNTKKSTRKYTYPLLIIGGICLEIYSIYIKDTIFIILQTVYILVNIYGWIKTK